MRDAKENREIKWPREILLRASRAQDFTRPFFSTVFFRVTHDGLSERGTTRCLGDRDKNYFSVSSVGTSLLHRPSLGSSRNLPSTITSVEAKETFLALCLLTSRSRLRTLNPEKFNGYQRDLSTIMRTLSRPVPIGCKAIFM